MGPRGQVYLLLVGNPRCLCLSHFILTQVLTQRNMDIPPWACWRAHHRTPGLCGLSLCGVTKAPLVEVGQTSGKGRVNHGAPPSPGERKAESTVITEDAWRPHNRCWYSPHARQMLSAFSALLQLISTTTPRGRYCHPV